VGVDENCQWQSRKKEGKKRIERGFNSIDIPTRLFNIVTG
jgi:hypothetical protein